MWRQGTIGIPDENGTYTSCKWWVKQYEETSEEYGIDGGRISKLMIKVNGEVTANYDRGWDVRPADEATKAAYAILIKEFN